MAHKYNHYYTEQAFLQGAPVQVFDESNNKWVNHSRPAFIATVQYRVDPDSGWARRQPVLPALASEIVSCESDPSGVALSHPGAKADNGKIDPTLILGDMPLAIMAVSEVATFGAKKYSRGGWLKVKDAKQRYQAAGLRHTLKRNAGESIDQDSKLLHLAHEAWNALAVLELHLRRKGRK